MIFPEYQGRSIVNLMQTITDSLGESVGLYPPLEGLDAATLKEARNVVLFVIDGLGYEYLCQQPQSALYKHLHARITTVAPPTTASAVSTYLTGLAPQQHALTGWFTYMRELGSVVTVLPYMLRAGGPSLGTLNKPASQLLNLPSVFDRLFVDSYSVMPDWLQQSEFNRMVTGIAQLVPYSGYQHCFDEVVRLAQQSSRKYIYAYWAGFDALAHEYGVNSAEVINHFYELDESFENLLAQLQGSDSVVMLCSDHGFIDSPPERRLNLTEFPELQECLQVPLCGEPRLAYCYVRHDKRDLFERCVSEGLGHAVELFTSQELIDKNLFGLGESHSELSARVGDYTLVMQEDYVMTGQLPGDKPPAMVGYHGGLSAAEVYVPLVMVEC